MNNRQNGRRRGRGGQQARNGQPGSPDRGNRIDNRARGNAAQLLEKYKNLARDSQMQGDRVTTEYYLQFADHYFRVLSESRSRFEDQRPQRRDEYRDEFGQDGDFDNDGARGDDRDDGQWGESERPQAQQPPRRFERPEPQPAMTDAEEGDAPEFAAPVEEAPRPARRPRRERAPAAAPNGNGHAAAAPEEEAPARIEMDRLPAGFAPVPAVEGEVVADEAPRPRRRARRPRGEEATVDA